MTGISLIAPKTHMDTEKRSTAAKLKTFLSEDTPFPQVCLNFRKRIQWIKEEFSRSTG